MADSSLPNLTPFTVVPVGTDPATNATALARFQQNTKASLDSLMARVAAMSALATGSRGDQGQIGPRGIPGDPGGTGATGDAGVPGSPGISGSVGPPGPAGSISFTTAGFTQPNSGSTVSVNVTSGSLFSPGYSCTIALSGTTNYYNVVTGSSNTLTLKSALGSNLGQGTWFQSGLTVTVASSNAPISASVIGTGQALVLNASNQLVPQAHAFVWNVQTSINGLPGAKGDGTTDDTAAIQRAINLFSGRTNTTLGVLYFPYPGFLKSYKVTATLQYTGSNGTALTMMGDMPASQAAVSTTLQWQGPASGTLMSWNGANNCVIENLTFDGNNSAQVCFWIHTDQPNGGADSNNIHIRHCIFQNALGTGTTDGNYDGTQGIVTLGDALNTQQVSNVNFEDCLIYGSGYQVGQTFACVNVLGGGNTEQFTFTRTNFLNAQYGFYWNYQANNTLDFHDCGWGLISRANVLVNGSTTTRMTNCGCENGGLAAPFTGKGLWIVSGQADTVYINGGEQVMDCSTNLYGSIAKCNGRLEWRNSKVDGSGEANNNVGSIIIGGAPYGSAIVENCLWAGATEQIPFYDSGGGQLTCMYSSSVGGNNNLGQQSSQQISMRGNQGCPLPTYSPTIRLPNYTGIGTVNSSHGLIMGAGLLNPLITGSIINQTRTTTTCIQLPYTLLSQSSPGSTTYNLQSVFFVPVKTKVVSIISEITTAFSGAAGLTNLSCSLGGVVTTDNWLRQFSLMTATGGGYGPIGTNAAFELGSSLTGSMQGGSYLAWNTQRSINFYFSSTGANMSALTQGMLSTYVTLESLGQL